MAERDGVGGRLDIAMRAVKPRMTGKALAKALGTHVVTVSRWLNNATAPKEQELVAAARALGVSAAWLRYGVDGPGVVREAPPPYIPRVAAGLSKAVRVWLQKFLLELAKAGVSQEEIDAVRVSMTSPEHFTIHFAGDRATESSDAEVLRVLEGYADMYRGSLRRKGYKL